MGQAGLVLGLTQTRLASVRWRAKEHKIDCRKNRLSQFPMRVSIGRAQSVVGIIKGHRNLRKKKKVTGNWKNSLETRKKPPKIGIFCQKLKKLTGICIFSLKISWIFLDLAKSQQIQPNLVEISPDLACFYRIWPDFFYSFGRVWVAWVLEMQTRHSTVGVGF